MNGKKAKQIRKMTYKDKDFRDRKYHKLDTGQLIADNDRRKYQLAKRLSR